MWTGLRWLKKCPVYPFVNTVMNIDVGLLGNNIFMPADEGRNFLRNVLRTSPHSVTTRKTKIDNFTSVRNSNIIREISWLVKLLLASQELWSIVSYGLCAYMCMHEHVHKNLIRPIIKVSYEAEDKKYIISAELKHNCAVDTCLFLYSQMNFIEQTMS